MKGLENSSIKLINEMKSELKSNQDDFKKYNNKASELISAAKNKNEENDFRRYKEIVDGLFSLVETLAKNKETFAENFTVGNPLSLTLEALTEFLDRGITYMLKVKEIDGKWKSIFTAGKREKYEKILEDLNTEIDDYQFDLQKNWVLYSHILYAKALIKALGDFNLIAKLVPIASNIYKKDYAESLKGIWGLAQQIQGTEIVDIWYIKRMVQPAQQNSDCTKILQEVIGKLTHKSGYLPLIYAAHDALFAVFLGAAGDNKEKIRRMVLGSEAESMKDKTNYSTLVSLSGKHNAAVFENGIGPWFRYICGIGQLNKIKTDLSMQNQDELGKIIHYLNTAKEHEYFFKEIRKWLDQALDETGVLLVPDDKMSGGIKKTEDRIGFFWKMIGKPLVVVTPSIENKI